MTSRQYAWGCAAVGLVFALVPAAGCRREQRTPPPGEKQARLLAAQNVELKDRLAEKQAQIESLQREHARQLRQRQKELAQCRARNTALQQDLDKGIAERVKSVTARVVDENAKLRREIEVLRAEIVKLKDKTEVKAAPLEAP
jgi:cell division protein FtsB